MEDISRGSVSFESRVVEVGLVDGGEATSLGAGDESVVGSGGDGRGDGGDGFEELVDREGGGVCEGCVVGMEVVRGGGRRR